MTHEQRDFIRRQIDAQVREQVKRDAKDRHAGPRRPFRT